jgi:hypothetical protein
MGSRLNEFFCTCRASCGYLKFNWGTAWHTFIPLVPHQGNSWSPLLPLFLTLKIEWEKECKFFLTLFVPCVGWVSAVCVRLATRWTVWGLNPGGGASFHTCPDWLGGSPSFLYNEYRLVLITNLMHNFIYSMIIYITSWSSTCFERRCAHLPEDKLYIYSFWYCHTLYAAIQCTDWERCSKHVEDHDVIYIIIE